MMFDNEYFVNLLDHTLKIFIINLLLRLCFVFFLIRPFMGVKRWLFFETFITNRSLFLRDNFRWNSVLRGSFLATGFRGLRLMQ